MPAPLFLSRDQPAQECIQNPRGKQKKLGPGAARRHPRPGFGRPRRKDLPQPEVLQRVEQRRRERAPACRRPERAQPAQVTSRRQQGRQGDEDGVGGHEQVIETQTERDVQAGGFVPRGDHRRGAFRRARQLVRDDAVRGGGRAQGRIESLEDGEHAQGQEQERDEERTARGAGDKFEGMLHGGSVTGTGGRSAFQRFAIDAIILVFHAVEVLQVGAHLLGGLGHLGHLHVAELAELQQGAPHLGVQQRVAAFAMILGQDAHAVDRHGAGTAHLQQQVGQRERIQAAPGALQGRRDVVEGEQEADRLLAVGDNLDQAVVGHGQDILDHEVDFAFGEGEIFPVVDEGLVVGVADAVRPVDQFLLVLELLDRQPAALGGAARDALHPFGDLELVGGQVAGDEIHFLDEALRLDQFLVIGIVVGQHGHGLTMFEAEHLNPVPIQRTQALRPDGAIQPTRPGPLEDGLEQGRGGLRVVLALEEVEIGFFRMVILIEWTVLDGGDAAHVAAVAHSQEEFHVGVLVKGMLLRVKLVIRVQVERRHPLRTVSVEAMRKFHKTAHLGFVGGIYLFDVEHETTPWSEDKFGFKYITEKGWMGYSPVRAYRVKADTLSILKRLSCAEKRIHIYRSECSHFAKLPYIEQLCIY